MNSPAFVLAALLSLCGSHLAHAAQEAGSIERVSGMVVAVKPDGRQRILSAASRVEVGDTLVSQSDSYVRLVLDNGNEALLGPVTTLTLQRYSAQDSALALAGGQVQVTGSLRQGPGHRFTLEAGGTTAVVGSSSFIARYVAAVGAAVALRQAWLRNSLAAAGAGPLTDGGNNQPLRDIVAQGIVPSQGAPAGGGLAPGLYVHVIDGLIQLSNRGGVQQFAAGQFGFTGSVVQPPVIVPRNPGIQFSPPPSFSQSSSPASGSKPGAVDCEVR